MTLRKPARRSRFAPRSLTAMLALCAAASGCTPKASAGSTDAKDAGIDGSDAAKKAALVGPDGGLVAATNGLVDAGPAAAQDEALPPATSDDLTSRAKHLVEAIAQDNPELAADIAFPRDAYLASRDATDAARGWEKNVNAPFARSVHLLHKRMKGLEHAQFVSIELGHALMQVTPKKKDWKKPLWKVRHSRIAISIDGRTQRIEIAEMMGWRGAWYVTKIR